MYPNNSMMIEANHKKAGKTSFNKKCVLTAEREEVHSTFLNYVSNVFHQVSQSLNSSGYIDAHKFA